MKLLITAAAALTLSGSALAYQTTSTDMDVPPSGSAAMTMHTTLDPTVTLEPPIAWNEQQRALWNQHIMHVPPAWTASQRAAWESQLRIPPAQWTETQRLAWQQHYTHLPAAWTADQRAMYQQQIGYWETPWVTIQHSAAVVMPSNANPERDARGIAVISDPAYVPAGFNGFPATAMGGPLVDAEGNALGTETGYPPCTASVTDNCIQLYERGVTASLASYDGSGGLDRRYVGMGGPLGEDEVGDNTAEDDFLDVDTRPDGSIDVDGDLDGDGDNDLE